ncbi:MAG: VanW family protein [Clostridia bacterium]|nr:VanW family protein [Clostridia bacterium]
MKKLMLLISAVIITAVFLLSKNVAFASEKGFTVIAGDKTYFFYGKQLSTYKGNLYINCLEGVVDGIFYDTAVFPTDASATFLPNGNSPFIYKEEIVGKGVDKERLILDIFNAIPRSENKVVATFIPLYPTVTLSDVKKYTYKMAEFSTEYKFSSESRKHNISVAVNRINGTVIKSGEEFSFNKVVGERTEKNGFKVATVIENGEYLDGVGGGVCQVSTTIYNCALLSGLKVKERYPHSILPSYVEPSFDAMVSGNAFDLKFVNLTSGNVYIKAVANGEKISFVFYGEKPIATYQRVSKSVEIIPAPSVEIIEDSEINAGDSEWVKLSKNGLKSEGYLKVLYADGREESVKLHTDNYKTVRGIMKVGTKVVDKAEIIRYDIK